MRVYACAHVRCVQLMGLRHIDAHLSLPCQALQEDEIQDMLAVLVPQHLQEWLKGHLAWLKAQQADVAPLVRFLSGTTESGKSFNPAFCGTFSLYHEVMHLDSVA